MDPRWFASDLSSFLIPAGSCSHGWSGGRHPGSLCLPEKFGVFGGDQYIKFSPKKMGYFFF